MTSVSKSIVQILIGERRFWTRDLDMPEVRERAGHQPAAGVPPDGRVYGTRSSSAGKYRLRPAWAHRVCPGFPVQLRQPLQPDAPISTLDEVITASSSTPGATPSSAPLTRQPTPAASDLTSHQPGWGPINGDPAATRPRDGDRTRGILADPVERGPTPRSRDRPPDTQGPVWSRPDRQCLRDAHGDGQAGHGQMISPAVSR